MLPVLKELIAKIVDGSMQVSWENHAQAASNQAWEQLCEKIMGKWLGGVGRGWSEVR